MSNRPIPRKGLLGCWFLDNRGIAYNAGANEAKDRSGKGNHATYQNGVTVGVEGDPSREFGAADFDASSNQFADVGDPLGIDGAQAQTHIIRVNSWDENARVYSNLSATGNGGRCLLRGAVGDAEVRISDANGNEKIQPISTNVSESEWFTLTTFVNDGQLGIRINGKVRTTPINGVTGASVNSLRFFTNLGASIGFLDGSLAAVARYDLTVSDAPEPSEIARKWDKLRDIPATR